MDRAHFPDHTPFDRACHERVEYRKVVVDRLSCLVMQVMLLASNIFAGDTVERFEQKWDEMDTEDGLLRGHGARPLSIRPRMVSRNLGVKSASVGTSCLGFRQLDLRFGTAPQ